MGELYKYRVVLVGCGKMGRAVLESLLCSRFEIKVCVVDPHVTGKDKITNGDVSFFDDVTELPTDFNPNIILFAVKPQLIKAVAQSYIKLVTEDVMVFSLLAGVSVDYFTKIYGEDKQIVRMMPNLGAEFGKSVTFVYSRSFLFEKLVIENFITAFGSCVWLDKEDKIHYATAVAGSGPAYYFLFFKYFTEFMIKNGFSEEEARNTVIDVCEVALLMAKGGRSFEKLMSNVTSPNGTTHAALTSFMQDKKLESVFDDALMAATKRSQELSNSD